MQHIGLFLVIYPDSFVLKQNPIDFEPVVRSISHQADDGIVDSLGGNAD